MSSTSYTRWMENRLGTIQALKDAHQAVGGDERGRRWTTAELNRLMTVSAVGEFSAFVRELFIESVQAMASAPQSLALPTQQLVAALADATARSLTNPWPDQIARLFRGVGMTQTHAFWQVPEMQSRVPTDRDALRDVVELRNSLAHGGTDRVTLNDVRSQVRLLKRLARSSDQALGSYLATAIGSRPWPTTYGALGPPLT